MMAPDFLVVGGGTAGAVLASRLSQDPSCRVLLVEAGDDTTPGKEPADIRDAFPTSTLNARYFWSGLTAAARDGATPAPYPQARVMGGGSSINGLFALRGVPSDYERWALAGAEGFSWESVLPYFRKAESDGQSAQRTNGPHSIERVARDEWPAFARAMEQAASRAGLPFIDDINEQPRDGFFAMPNAVHLDARVTAPGCYLNSEVRARPNLEIWPNSVVSRLQLTSGSVSGVEVIRGGRRVTVAARNVIVTAGAIHSPVLLLRSGIGSAAELAALGIPAALDLPGVGRNLQNHPYMFFALTLPRAKRVAKDLRRFALTGLRASSGHVGAPGGDLFGFVIGRVSGESFGPSFALVGSALYAPMSRGFVRLNSADPLASPEINFRFMSDPADAPRMVAAARLTEGLLRDAGVASNYHEAYLLPGALSVKQFNRPGMAGRVLAMAAGVAANSPGSLRRFVFSRALKSGAPVAQANGGRAISDEEILSSISPMGHPVGTCAMGRSDDSMAVVDQTFRVHGTTNLFVADASVMPVIPSANTNLPTVMLAELAADRIRSA